MRRGEDHDRWVPGLPVKRQPLRDRCAAAVKGDGELNHPLPLWFFGLAHPARDGPAERRTKILLPSRLPPRHEAYEQDSHNPDLLIRYKLREFPWLIHP